jgi:cell fate regulator YaaT (PSP1 superfamily)
MSFPEESAWDLDPGGAPGGPSVAAGHYGEEETEADTPDLVDPKSPYLAGLGEDDPEDLVLDLERAEPECLAAAGEACHLCNVVRVRLHDRARTSEFEAGEINVQAGESVVVETDQGLSVGVAAGGTTRLMSDQHQPRLIRRIDHNDMRQQARNSGREREAFDYCREKIKQRKLPMKLIRAEYLHGGNKAIFYFAAEHRVDFRDLVKDLAQKFHTRIVMRQVGVRDESKMTGGIGSCGATLCCAKWLPKFEPVSIRMAKDQNLVLNPQKVSGQCGRLKCCLTYEQTQYQEARKGLPKPGRIVKTPDGDGRVQEVDILRRRVKVCLQDGNSHAFDADVIEQVPGSGPRRPPKSS